MDIRIDGLHEQAMVEIMARNNEKTGTGMARILIRDAAISLGIWPGSEIRSTGQVNANPHSETLPAQ